MTRGAGFGFGEAGTAVQEAPFAPSSRLAEALRAEAARLGTPAYVYDAAGLDRRARDLVDAFPDPGWIRLFSLKANGVPGIVRRVAAHGFGANAVSSGEIELATRAGVRPGSIALEGVGKTPRDLRRAVELAAEGRPLLWVSLESGDEAAALADLAARTLGGGARVDVLVRVNPAVQPETHTGLAVGRATSKFGVSPREVGAVLRAGGGRRGALRWRGLHVHVGSQLSSVDAWTAAVAAALDAFAAHRNGALEFDTLDVGGGFAAGLDKAPAPHEFAAALTRSLHARPPESRPSRLATEPGRYLVAEAGWLLARVLHVRVREGEGGRPLRLVVLDAGMTELMRPALYGAEHPVFALTSLGRPTPSDAELHEAIVDGPVCESTDRLGEALLPDVERGDLVAVGLAGAYASAMFSTYNGRPRPPEVIVEPDGSRTVLRPRGTVRSLP